MCSVAAPANRSIQLSILPNATSPTVKFGDIIGPISLLGNPSLNVSQVDISGRLIGDVTGQRVGSGAGGIRVAGDILGEITTIAKAGGPFSAFDITLIESVNGSILGNVIASGKIDNVFAKQGTIGTPTSPVQIQCTLPSPGDLIRFIEAKSVHAHISTPNNVVRVRTTGTGPNEGDFSGSIVARRIQGGADPGVYGLDISRDLLAAITLTGTTTTDVNDEFVIGRSFPDGGFVNGVSNYRISAPAGRITKQIIVNSRNIAGATATGQVRIANSALNPATYPNEVRAVLGGGAYGKVP